MSNDRDLRLSQATLKVLRFLMSKPREKHSGAEISKATKVGSGTMYPMLIRLEAAGWLMSEWEAVDPREAGRPRRRFYQLTGAGYRNAHAALAELQIPTGELIWTS
jgi:PadR family transcriptional regulator, regulatory protein PadR